MWQRKRILSRQTEKSSAQNRNREYDAVIIRHSQFEKIPLSKERQIETINRQIADITFAIEDMAREEGTRFTVKQMEKTKKTLQEKLKKLNDQTRKDDVVTFEQLGVDRLFVDESHYYKNLFYIQKCGTWQVFHRRTHRNLRICL